MTLPSARVVLLDQHHSASDREPEGRAIGLLDVILADHLRINPKPTAVAASTGRAATISAAPLVRWALMEAR